MAIQRTLALIKPDIYKAKKIGKIISMIEDNGFTLIHIMLFRFTEKSASQFYNVHQGKDFFDELIKFSTSDKVLALVLEKENAIADFRKLMGATDPKKAEPGTIRALYGTGMPDNAVHGSDSEANAKKEITYIFGEFASIPSTEKKLAKQY